MSAAIIPVVFHGDTVDCARDDAGVWVGVRRVCEALGVDHSAQLAKLRSPIRAGWLNRGVNTMVAPGADGKAREQIFIHLDDFPLWLATIDAGRVRKDLRDKLVAYQRECAQVLRDHFFGPSESAADSARAVLSDEALKFGCRAIELALQVKALDERGAAVRHAALIKAATGFDLFAVPDEAFAVMLDPLEQAVTDLKPGESVEVDRNGKKTIHYAPPEIPAGYALASTIAGRYTNVSTEDVRNVARSLGLWQKEPGWGVFDGLDRATGKPAAGKGAFYFSPAAEAAMTLHLLHVDELKPERLPYVKALDVAAQRGPEHAKRLSTTDGPALRALVRELLKARDTSGGAS